MFIGIDFSKKTFDVSVVEANGLEKVCYQRFENSKAGCSELLEWLGSQTKENRANWLFCGEHTGLYGVLPSGFLIRKALFLWMEKPLQVKLSTGIKRDKNDKVDSLDIAMYAYRCRDRAKQCQLPDKSLASFELLLAFRERLLANKHSLPVSSAEIRRVIQRDTTARYIYEQSKKSIERLNKEIKEVEKRMLEQVTGNKGLNENHEPVSSIKGIALINTVAIIVATQNFTRFGNARQFACYAGMAPFGKQSGTSVKGKPHASRWADRKIKTLLTQAVKCAIRHDRDTRLYYERKIAEGKNDWLVINNLRNKMIHRIFALVRNKELYQVNGRVMPNNATA